MRRSRHSYGARWVLLKGALAVLLVLATGDGAWAQDGPPDVVTSYDSAVRALTEGNHDAGLAAVEAVIRHYGETGMDLYGPAFGHFYYLKGLLLIRKGMFAEAKEPLGICHEKFTNDKATKDPVEGQRVLLPNRFRWAALVQKAGCHLMLREFVDAAPPYEIVLREAGDDPEVNRVDVQINLALCYLNFDDKVDKGRDFLLDQLRAETASEPVKRRVFLALVSEWGAKAARGEVSRLAADMGGLVMRAPLGDRMDSFNPVLIRAASASAAAGDALRALVWLRLAKSPDAALRELEEQIKTLRERRVAPAFEPQKQAALKELEDRAARWRGQVTPLLLGMAGAHFGAETYAASRAGYLRLESMGAEVAERPVVLHNLVACAANMNRWKEVIQYGDKFFAEFPDHELRPAVARLMVEILFLDRNYDEAHRVAGEVREGMNPGDANRDIPDFVRGAAAFHLGRSEEAEAELDAYLTAYPEGQRIEPARFYLAASKVNLQKWTEAAERFDAFLNDYPGTPLRPAALHLASLSHLVLGNHERCGICLGELQERFPDAAEIPASFNVLGDLRAAEKMPYEEVSAAFLRARDLVEKEGRGDRLVAAYALKQLIAAAGSVQEWEAAAGYFDAFEAGYADTQWRIDAVVAALEPLVKLDRKDDGRARLEELVTGAGTGGQSPALDEIMATYSDFLRSHWPEPEVLARLETFPAAPPPQHPALESWLVTARIQTLEAADEKKRDAKAIRDAFIKLTALYETHGKELSNFSLVKLARWTLEDRKMEAAAREIYDFILKERPYGDALGLALVEKAKIDAAKPDPESRKAARDGFETALAQIKDPKMHEEAVLGIARLLTADKRYEEAMDQWKRYLNERTWSRARAEANWNYGLCLDQQGKAREALKIYVSVYANFTGHLDWSTRAYIRTALILRENGKKVEALKVLQDMLKRIGQHNHPGVQSAKGLFIQWRKEYEAEAKG